MPPRDRSPPEASAAPELGQQEDPRGVPVGVWDPPTRDMQSSGTALPPCTGVSSPEPGCCPGQGIWEMQCPQSLPIGCRGWEEAGHRGWGTPHPWGGRECETGCDRPGLFQSAQPRGPPDRKTVVRRMLPLREVPSSAQICRLKRSHPLRVLATRDVV